MENSMIAYHNSGLGYTNEWYEKLKIEIPRVCHKYLNADFSKKIYGNIINTNESDEDIEVDDSDDPVDDD